MTGAKQAGDSWPIILMLAFGVMGGCGDDDVDEPVGGDTSLDAAVSGSRGLDAGAVDSTGSRSPDAGVSLDTIVRAEVSATGHDRFYGVAHDLAGNIYAVGQTSSSTASDADFALVVAKFNPAGVLDVGFGSGGYAIKNVAEGGTSREVGRGIVVQASGRIVIAGDAEHDPRAPGVLASDTDMVLVGFLPSGALDSSFGAGGVARHDISTAVETFIVAADGAPQGQVSGADATWGFTEAPDGKLVLHGVSRAVGVGVDGGVRSDTDYTLLRLLPDGALDPSFGGSGIVRTDFAQTSGTARSATVLADGSVVGSGYATTNVLAPGAQQPVLYKLNPDGTPDARFGTTDPVMVPGLWHGFARADGKGAEAYGATAQGAKLVTAGYGPTPLSGTGTDWLWLRFHADGTPDTSFGTNGTTFIDVAGYQDNGRAISTLADGRVIGVGGGRPRPFSPPAPNTQPANIDGMVAVLTENGQPDEHFGRGGYRLYELGGNTDFFWAVKLAPNRRQVAVVGIAGGSEPGADDDAALVIIDVEP